MASGNEGDNVQGSTLGADIDMTKAEALLHNMDKPSFGKVLDQLILESEQFGTAVEPGLANYLRNARNNAVRDDTIDRITKDLNRSGKRDFLFQLVLTQSHKRPSSSSSSPSSSLSSGKKKQKLKIRECWPPNSKLWEMQEDHLRGIRREELDKLSTALNSTTANLITAFQTGEASLMERCWELVSNGSPHGFLRHVLFSCQSLSLEQRIAECQLEFTAEPCVAMIHDHKSRDEALEKLQSGAQVIIREGYALEASVCQKLKTRGCTILCEQASAFLDKDWDSSDNCNTTESIVEKVIEELKVRDTIKAELREHVPRTLGSAVKLEKKQVVFENMEVKGLGPFPFHTPTSYKLDVPGVHWVTAAQNNTRNNGMGKSTLCVSAFLWCLTGVMEDKGSIGTRTNVELIHWESNEACVTLTGTIYPAIIPFTVMRQLQLVKKDTQTKTTFRATIGGEEMYKPSTATVCQTLFGLHVTAETKLSRQHSGAGTMPQDDVKQTHQTPGDCRAFLLHTLLYSRHGHLALSASKDNRRRAVQQLDDVAFLADVHLVASKELRRIEKRTKELSDLENELTATKTVLVDSIATFERDVDLRNQLSKLQEQHECAKKKAEEVTACFHVANKKSNTCYENLQKATADLSAAISRQKQLTQLSTQHECPTCCQLISQDIVQHLIPLQEAEVGMYRDKEATAREEHAKAKRVFSEAQAAQTKATADKANVEGQIKSIQDANISDDMHISQLQLQLQRLQETEVVMKNNSEELATLKQQAGEWKLVKTTFSPQSGLLKTQLHKHSWHRINCAANRWLAKFFPRGYTPFALSVDDDTGSTLLWTNSTRKGSLQGLSTSQLMRVELAFFLGFSDELLRSKNITCNLRVLDELFYGLDAMSVALVLDSVAERCEQDPTLSVFVPSVAPIKPIGFDWEQIIVLTHNGKVKQL